MAETKDTKGRQAALALLQQHRAKKAWRAIVLAVLVIAISLADLAGSLERHTYYRDIAANYLAEAQDTEQEAVCDR